MMKKILHLIALAFITLSTCGCEELFRDELHEIHSEIDELREMLEQTNSNIEALQKIIIALQNNDYVTDVTPIIENGEAIGYTIAFSKSGCITIYHGAEGVAGADGHTPVIGIRKDTDGHYYWTVDGQWLKDENGNKIRTTGDDGAHGEDGKPGEDGVSGQDGITPQLKIENGWWFISYDNGSSWTELGKATGENGAPGKDGDSVFKDIILSDNEITFITSDGSEFVVPRGARVRLILDLPENETGILPGSEIVINYALENASERTFVTASSNGIYSVRVEAEDINRGKVYVKAPLKYADGYINIMVTDGESFSFIKVVNFYEEKMLFHDGMEYYISPKGGTLTIPFSTNFEYEFLVENSAESWMEITSGQTKAEMTDGELKINIAENNFDYARTGKIHVIPVNSAGDMYTEIVINQASAFFSVEQAKYAVHVDGETITTQISSSRGLSVQVPDEASGWIRCEVKSLGEDYYRLSTTVQANETLNVRSAKVGLYSEDGSVRLGSIEFVQSSSVEDELSNMVLTVRAAVVNDFSVSFVLKGDCYIDWGDGQAERFQHNYKTQITHAYAVDTPADFTVKIYGDMPFFASGRCVKEVRQWGQTGLVTVDFSGDTFLQKVCPDEYEAFRNLESIYFQDCTTLKSLPSGLFRYCKKTTSFDRTFSGCTSLAELPEGLFENCTGATSFKETFCNCKSLKAIPKGLFKDCTNAIEFRLTFCWCESLTDISEGVFANCGKVTSFSETFYSCSSLTSIPEDLFAGCPNVTNFSNTFYNCKSLSYIPENLFANCPKVTSFYWTFADCHTLTEIPAGIFDNNRKVLDFGYTFANNRNITGESPYTVIKGVKYHLYERYKNPDYFVIPTSYDGCLPSQHFTDREAIAQHGWD